MAIKFPKSCMRHFEKGIDALLDGDGKTASQELEAYGDCTFEYIKGGYLAAMRVAARRAADGAARNAARTNATRRKRPRPR